MSVTINNTLDAFQVVESAVPLGIQGTRTTTVNSNATSHSITLPASIQVGEMIFVFFTVRYAPAVSINTGVSGNNWTLSTPIAYTAQITAAYAYKIAEGSDALTLTTDVSRNSGAISFRIASATTVYSSNVSATTSTPNPAILTPAGGSAEYVWIVGAAVGEAKTYSVFPTGYSNSTTILGGGSTAVSPATVDKLATASSDDPSAFTLSGAAYTIALTIAIK